MKFSESVKQVLLGKIQEMAASPGSFVRNPDRDFTRRRKLDFATTIQCLIAMESGSLKKELLELFRSIPTPRRHRLLTSSATRYCRKRCIFCFGSSMKPLLNIEHTVDIDCSPVTAQT